ncbi:MAG TPA: flagellar hook-basal body complex protein [Phenylobacterium sp.]|nr:flagellar hook-basal body complex protein [Phenylobacterium sp.]
MSVNSALLAGVQGLAANSAALAAISDNIVNVNTTGYKRNQTSFIDIVTAQAVKGRYSAGGVTAVNHKMINQQGQLQSSTSSTDLAISGEGFFVVSSQAGALAPADERLFTRAGSFNVDDAGYYLLGWPVGPDGTIDTSPTDITKLEQINIRNLGGVVSPTTEIEINGNLNADTPFSGQTYAAGAMRNYANDPTTAGAVRPDYTIETQVVDSLGNKHTVAISFLKKDPATAGDENEWFAEVYTVPVTDIDGTAPIAAGDVKFTPDGQLDPTGTTLFGGANDFAIAIGASNAGPAPKWATALGIDGQSVTFDLLSANGGLTQLGGASTVDSLNANGATLGNVVGVQVSESGLLSVIFDNNEVRAVSQIAVATFINPNGMIPVSGDAFRSSINSGDFALKRPGEGNAGLVAASSLEASTVDLAAEFTSLITTQRAYSASSKIITTADEMLEELINIKR